MEGHRSYKNKNGRPDKCTQMSVYAAAIATKTTCLIYAMLYIHPKKTSKADLWKISTGSNIAILPQPVGNRYELRFASSLFCIARIFYFSGVMLCSLS